MDLQLLYEIIGYIASVLVAISLMMRSILKLRILNLIGSLFFTVYGLVIQAYPVAAVNFFIVLVNLYFLYQIYIAKEYFTLLPESAASDYLQYFLDFHRADIQTYEPGFSFELNERQLIFFILRDLVPAGLFVAEPNGPDSLFVQLDYVIPGYRDFKLGRYLYNQQSGIFQERGIYRIYARPGNEMHQRYLRRMGFAPERAPDGETLYCLNLSEQAEAVGGFQQRGG